MATVTVTLLVGVLSLVVFVLLGVVIELYRDVRQLRDAMGILDRPLDVDLGKLVGRRPSEYDLPNAIDTVSSAVVLFLSDRCSTCRALAEGFAGYLPPGLWVILEARTPKSASEFLVRYQLRAAAGEGRLVVDAAGAIAERIGLRTTPVGFRVKNGRFVSASTVPSRRYLRSLLGGEYVHFEQANRSVAG